MISGEKIQQLCDVFCGTEYDLNRNTIISTQKNKHINIGLLNSEWNNPTLIFCYSCSLSIFLSKLYLFKNKFVLVSHNEDTNITDEYRILADSKFVIRWYAQNVMMVHPKLHLLPIGIANAMWLHGNPYNFININKEKENKIYFYFNISTNTKERQICKNILESKGLQFGSLKSHTDYLNDLSKCKFAICPPGNGIDCHRTWECYYMNVIPILLRSTFTEHLSNILPCILLNNWNDFNFSVMNNYDELNSSLQKNKIYIDFNYYKNSILSDKSYSHSDCKNLKLDIKLDTIIKKTNGFYIELGANNGLNQSNTAFFEFNRGWTGILIEPSIGVFNECIMNRPNSLCYNYACVSNDYEYKEITGDFNGSLMSSVNGSRLKSGSLTTVNTITLEKLLDMNNIIHIDLLSLDTEGYELNILKGLNLLRFRPNYMLIEIYSNDYTNIIQFLEEHKYKLICNFTNYNKVDNPHWDETHNDYLFKDNLL